MREIKFRAWDKADLCMCNVLEMRFDNEELIKVGYTFDGSDDIEKACLRYPSQLELMQYTGLKDKNGKEIYEGDVVRNLRYKSIAQVLWRECKPSTAGVVKGVFGEESDLTGFISNLGEFDFQGIGGSTRAFYIDEFEIIGNIYESPELIKTT